MFCAVAGEVIYKAKQIEKCTCEVKSDCLVNLYQAQKSWIQKQKERDLLLFDYGLVQCFPIFIEPWLKQS